MKKILFFLSVSLTILGCKKNDFSIEKEYKVSDLINEYNLKFASSINGFKSANVKKFDNLVEAKNYLSSLEAMFKKKVKRKGIAKIYPFFLSPLQKNASTGTISQKKPFDPSVLFLKVSPTSACGPCSSGNAYASGGFGNFSDVNFQFDYQSGPGGYQINNVNSYVTGVPIGISWNQQGNPVNYSSSSYISFCVTGTVTVGLQVGDLTLGYIFEYNYQVQMDPCTGGYDVTSSMGHC